MFSLKKNKKKRNRPREKIQKKDIIIVAMASRRRAMKVLGRVTFPPDTTSGGGASRVSARDLPEREERTKKTRIYLYEKVSGD